MKTTVIQTTETVSGREYPLTITRQVGRQQLLVGGELLEIVELTIFDSPLGRSRCWTRAMPEASPEEREAGRRQIQSVAEQAMRDQGMW